MIQRISKLLGDEADRLLGHRCETISRQALQLPGPDFLDRVFIPSDRSPRVLANLERLFAHGRRVLDRR